MSRWINAEWLLRFFEPFGDNYHTPLGVLRACIDDAPTIKTKEVKYYDENEKVWKIGSVIVDETS